MVNEICSFALVVFAGAAAVILTAYLVDRWLTAPDRAKPRLRRPLRVRKIKQKEGPRIRRIDFPDGAMKGGEL